MKKQRKQHKNMCSNHRQNILIGIGAFILIIILALFSEYVVSIRGGIAIQGAAVLKNKCMATPELFLLFGSNDNYVYALDAKKGCNAWKFETNGDIKSKVAASAATVYVGTTENNLYAIILADGSQKWEIKDLSTAVGKIYGAPAGDSSYVYAADNLGVLGAYSIDSGDKVWSYQGHNMKPDVILDNGTLYVVDEYLKVGSLVAVDATTHTAKWSFSAKNQILAAPLVTTDAIYLPATENTLYKLNKNAGVAVWKFTTERSIRMTPTIDDAGILYIGSYDGYFYAVNSKDGKLLWKYAVNSEMQATPVVDDKYVYFGALNNKVYALDKKIGTKVWEFKTNGKIYGALLLNSNILYVPSADYSMYALNAATGQTIWSYATKGALYGGGVIAE